MRERERETVRVRETGIETKREMERVRDGESEK